MSSSTTPTYALPTEPLLEIQTHVLARARAKPIIRRWLLELEAIGELYERAETVAMAVRKRLGGNSLEPMLEGMLAVAADAERSGVAALAAIIAVRAQGLAVVDMVHEFRHLHRVGSRSLYRVDHGLELSADERKLLDEVEAVERELSHYLPNDVDPFALPSPLDLGPARVPRKVFEVLTETLNQSGELDDEGLSAFVRLARMEQVAAGMRASAVAGEINPYSAKAVSAIMPRLAELDAQIRDVKGFLDALDEQRESRLFHEQHSVFLDVLSDEELTRLQEFCEGKPRLSVFNRLLDGVRRNPIAPRQMAYYVDRLLHLGNALFFQHLRPVPIDPLEAVLLALEYVEGKSLMIPTGPKVNEIVTKARLDGLVVESDHVAVPFDLAAARRVHAPAGLPLPPDDEDQGEDNLDNIKDIITANLNNTSILLGLLKNPKVINKPGVVAFIANACRLPRVLEVIAQTKSLHTGFANKDVPLAIVRSPVRLPVKLVRRFIHVKYIRRVELRRLARDKTGLRREIYDEIVSYLATLA